MCNSPFTLHVFLTLVQLLQFNSLRNHLLHIVRRRTYWNQHVLVFFRDLVPCEKAKTLVNWYGHKAIAQVSDCVRLLAVTRFGGWVTDADNVWLRPPPLGDYHFATLPMKRTGGRANQRLPTTAAWGRQPSREWDGKGHSGTPMHFPSLPSKFAQDVAEFVTKFMNNCISAYYYPRWLCP